MHLKKMVDKCVVFWSYISLRLNHALVGAFYLKCIMFLYEFIDILSLVAIRSLKNTKYIIYVFYFTMFMLMKRKITINKLVFLVETNDIWLNFN